MPPPGLGDLIVARTNDRHTSAGQPGRWLANRDVLRIESADLATVTVRRMTGRDPDTGRPAWTPPFRLSRAYVFSHCDLGYATTVHAAQGRTVDTAHTLVDGLGHRQWLYVAMSRGQQANYAYCVTGYPRLADPQPGARRAPEFRRARALALEAAGLRPAPGQATLADADLGNEGEQHRDPQAVLADIVQRDGSVLSATETLRTELANADHLGVLASIWYDLARRAQITRYTSELRDTLPEPLACDALTDPACTWLWRSLRQAEAAGLTSADVLREAAGARSLADARNVARALDSRIRRMIAHLPPAGRSRWADQVPQTGDPDVDRFLAELATAMDDRTERIGEHVTETQPAWAVHVLGPVPHDPGERAGWQRKAGIAGAYREMYGYQSQADAIGPEPARTSPEAWANWHHAFAAIDRVDGIDLRGLSDGQLKLRRATYQRELAWAPPYVADELRLARLQARTAWENAIRANQAAHSAVGPPASARHRDLARISVYLGTAWEVSARRERDAIIQPPRPDITPAAAVLQRAQQQMAEPEHEMEAG